MLPRERTRRLLVGDRPLGGGAPVLVQSMLTTPTTDVALCLEQIERLAAAGCELIRLALPGEEALAPFATICANSPLPVVADIHFDARLAIAAAQNGAAKLRINPGNIGSLSAFDSVLDAADQAGIPLRVGVNAGSLAPEFAERADLSLPERLVASAEHYVRHCERRGFLNIVISAKAHDVSTTVQTYRLLAQRLPDYPLHLGVTEAGTSLQGSVRSAVGIGTLLLEGIGDTLRVSLTADPLEEIRVAWEILTAVGLRRRGPELISCPTCARCEVDLIPIAEQVEAGLAELDAALSVAVMGCIVNGPGEARQADVGVACGKGKAALFASGEVLYTVQEAEICTALLREARRLAAAG
jgi:(E)-4-hydroxy-3-methylbut-2-enyl-diphosphate synthase